MTLAETVERLTARPDLDLISDLPEASSGLPSQPEPDLTGTTDRDDQRSTLEFWLYGCYTIENQTASEDPPPGLLFYLTPRGYSWLAGYWAYSRVFTLTRYFDQKWVEKPRF